MLAAFTLLHVLISLVAIATGFVVTAGLTKGDRMDRMTAWFLGTTLATSVTGFMFPFNGITPGQIFGVLTFLALGPAIYGRYKQGLDGGWRKTFVIGSVFALYLNFFVLIVQSFQKVPALKALAPTQSEPPFAVAQLVALVAFLVLGYKAVKGFREPMLFKTKVAAAN
jgi:hypothetical protein